MPFANYSDINSPFKKALESPYVSQGTIPKEKKNIIMLYSLETPLFSELNRANQYRDVSMAPHLGPYAVVLNDVLVRRPKDLQDIENLEGN